jgi:hypothetical protein
MNKLKFKNIIIGLIVISITSCSSQSDFIKTSNEIYKRAIENNDNRTFKKIVGIDKKIRKEIFKKGKISFFEKSEPLFIIDGYDLETDESYTEIWNSIGYVSYKWRKKDYEIVEENYYSENLKRLIKDWKTDTIKQNMIEKGIDLGGLDISITAIYFFENGEISGIKGYSFSQYEGCMKEIIEYE